MIKTKSVVTAVLPAFALHLLTRNTSCYTVSYTTLSTGEEQIRAVFIHLGHKTFKRLKQIYSLQ